MQFEVQFTVAISNMVSSRLGHFEGKFTVAISDLVDSRLCHFEGKFTLAIIDLVGSRLGQFEVQFTVAITIIRQFILFNIEKMMYMLISNVSTLWLKLSFLFIHFTYFSLFFVLFYFV